jgi:hypothetical protein
MRNIRRTGRLRGVSVAMEPPFRLNGCRYPPANCGQNCGQMSYRCLVAISSFRVNSGAGEGSRTPNLRFTNSYKRVEGICCVSATPVEIGLSALH